MNTKTRKQTSIHKQEQKQKQNKTQQNTKKQTNTHTEKQKNIFSDHFVQHFNTHIDKMKQNKNHLLNHGLNGALGGFLGASWSIYTIQALKKWVNHNVQLTIDDGERLDELVMTGFLTACHKSLEKMQNQIKQHPFTPSTMALKWNQDDDELLVKLAEVYSQQNGWKNIANNFTHKTPIQCARRWEELKPLDALQKDRTALEHYIARIEQRRARIKPEQQSTKNTQEKVFFGKLLKKTFYKLYYHAPTERMQTYLGLLYHIIQKIPHENVLEFLKGGHAIVHDKGELYVKVVTTEGSHPRVSSHYPQFKNAPHYGITIRVPKLPTMHMLTGIVRRQNKNVSWVQLESSPMPSLYRLFSHEGIVQNVKGLLSHAKDYLAHRHTKKQYGPLGASWFTEKGKHPNVIHIH